MIQTKRPRRDELTEPPPGMTACQIALGGPGGLWKLDSGPVIDFTLSVGIVACGHDCAVGTQAKGVR